ncbi:MAG: CoA-transferase [Anaerolineae bacterium]|jgi:acyl CoA:acetate/3-ketoacid CoA transferase beta subunit
MVTSTTFTTDDLICVCISRQIEDGQILAQGIATPPVAAGYFLARLTHAPNVSVASAVGNSLCQDHAPLCLTCAEDLWVGKALMFMSFAEAACELYPRYLPVEFFRPAQVDPFGNTNNIAIGELGNLRLRLPGCGGIADVTAHHPRAYLYVPRHSRAVFVEKLDLISGVGVARRGACLGDHPGPRLLISDLGVFDYVTGRMRLRSYHPGTSIDVIHRKTGFPLDVATDVYETPPPSSEEIRLLQEEIDPLGIRELDRMSGSRRRRKLREIILAEASAYQARSAG